MVFRFFYSFAETTRPDTGLQNLILMKTRFLRAILTAASTLFLTTACDIVNDGPAGGTPGITILGSSDVTSSSAVLKIRYISDGTVSRVQPSFRCGCVSYADYRGISGENSSEEIIALLSEKGLEGTVIFNGSPEGTATFEKLEPNTTYMAAAMVQIGLITYYSNTFEFTTEEGKGNGGGEGGGNEGNKYPTGVPATAKEVDLGLSVKWAGWNIGAEAPEQFGKYFAWGETTEWAIGWSGLSAYRFYDRQALSGNMMFTKYVTSPSYAVSQDKIDNLRTLLPEDDAATVAWGGKWRMPTDSEKTEFLANTTHVKSEYNGVKGYIFTSQKNGAAIFIPSAGMKMQGSGAAEEGTLCGFWTSSLRENNSEAFIACNRVENTWLLPDSGFEMDPQAESWHLGQYRWYGLPVRAVLGK